jgi:signal transduction histidine kinase/DNA-binding response OmpR family regulator/ligand-binding sensor domain-containing protein
MRYLKTLVVLALLFLAASDAAIGQPHPYRFNYLTVDVGLSHTDANDIIQDDRGYIWVATLFGLDRFDGYNIKRFYNSNEPLNNAFKNRVISLTTGKDGEIWLGTEGGLQCFDSKTERYLDFTIAGVKTQPTFAKLIFVSGQAFYGMTDRPRRYQRKGKIFEEQPLALPAGVSFSDMAIDSSENLYLAGDNGVWRLDKSGRVVHIELAGCNELHFSQVRLDNRGRLLLSTGAKLFLTDWRPGDGGLSVVKTYTSAPGTSIRDVDEDKHSDYWVTIGSGLIRLDSNLNPVQTIVNKITLNSLNSSSLNKLYIDRSQCLWVCTFGSGVNYCDLNEKMFYTFQHDPDVPNSLSGNYIRAILEEDKENLWIGTTYNGLNRYHYKTQEFSYYGGDHSSIRLKSKSIASLLLDDHDNLWIGTSAGIDILTPDRKHLWRPPGCEKFPTHTIEALVKDCYGNIWFGDHMDRLGVIWRDDHGTYQVKYYDGEEGYFIPADKRAPQLFVSSTHGLKRLVIDQRGEVLRTVVYTGTSSPNSLSSNYTYPICQKNDSTYWIGTIGGGLDCLVLHKDDSYNVRSFCDNVGIFKDVESLELDDAGNIWMGGNGLQCLNPTTHKLTRYDKNDGLQGNSFKVNASYSGVDGKLFFGGINGLNYFNPAEIRANPVPARPVLTDLLINNQRPQYGRPDSSGNTLDQIISYCSSLSLDYRQNNFVLSFSAMHYANPAKCKYRYKLVGYDKEWKFTDGKNPTAAYSNLDYNNYRFVVQATNNDGIWSEAQAVLPIAITPPWWKSLPAKIAYVSLFLAALLGIYIYQARLYRLKRELAVRAVNEMRREEMHKQREDLYQQQLQFFTNISHEFRTPLTLLLGPLEGLIKENKDSVLNNSYQLMFRNVKRLINLINELMNFKKVADSAIRLQVKSVAISPFCKSLFLEFEHLALSKDIRFTLVDHSREGNNGQMSNFFDAQVLEKILFNLLNNAFKYTNVGGEVRLEVFFRPDQFQQSFATEFHLTNEQHRAGQYIYFLIADTGIGISRESISSIFDRYYRISKNHLGSGVGLALVKSLTQLHKGDISVYSERYKGTEILVALPWGRENFSDTETVTSVGDAGLTQLESLDNSVLSPIQAVQDGQQLSGKIGKHILLVDDNEELRAFLRQSLDKFYYIYEAEDGQSALEIAANKMPDLIISDVMMPGMSGIELCKLVKDGFETSHIPCIILSAKDALDTKIEGMESGADYYFAKPLSIDLLVLTVHNIFEQGQKLKLKYTNDYLAEATDLVQSERDKQFVGKLLQLIEEHLQEPDLDVDFLCNHLFISRTKLYQKIKSISDQSVGEFIKTIRLKKAIQIMTHEDVPFNKIADRIGLQSQSYFSRVFKKEFGKTPSQFMQSLKKDVNSKRGE